MFWARRFGVERGMEWLRSRGHIHVEAEVPQDVPRDDVLEILQKAGMPMMAGEDFRK